MRILISLWLATCLVSFAAQKQPNIVFIFSDDHAPHAIGAYDGWLKSTNPTPHIDRLASEGMLFDKSFCTNSISSCNAYYRVCNIIKTWIYNINGI